MTDLTSPAHLITGSPYFNEDWYRLRYPDAAQSDGLTLAAHYLRFGWRLGRDPGPEFSTSGYLEEYGDRVAPGLNPLLHFLQEGRADGLVPIAPSGRHALIIHAGLPEALPDLAAHAAFYPARAPRFLLCPADASAEYKARIDAAFPGARRIEIRASELEDGDLGALCALDSMVDLSAFGFLCRIRAPRAIEAGSPDAARSWRRLGLKGTLPDTEAVIRCIADFRTDGHLVLGGAVRGVSTLLAKGAADEAALEREFLRTGSFWLRPALIPALKALPSELDPVQRLIAAAGVGAPIRLQDTARADQTRRSTLHAGSMPASLLPEPADSARPASDPDKLRGNLDNPTATNARGWIALLGDDAPRQALLTIGSSELEVTAGGFRDDLLRNGINAGWHAFQVQVPIAEMDGQLKQVVLRDGETGKVVARGQMSWRKPKPDYADFQGFLRQRMTLPVIEAPFAEEDKRCFAVMEGIANRFCASAAALATPPLVSVVMPVYNREAIVAEAIASVLAQEYPHFELIVVDDGSTDGSAAVIEGFADPRLRLLRLPENAGQTVARNTGLKAARGEILAFLDSDNQWDSRYLGATVGAFDALPGADVIYSGMLLYRGTADTPFAVRYGHFNRALLENKNYIDTNVIALRRRFLGDAPAFDETLRRYPDYDAILRFSETGRLVSVPMLLCHYYYDKAENAMTNDPRHAGDMEVIRSRMVARRTARLAAADQAGLARPVTVVIPNWQSLDDLRACLAALMARDWQGLLDIVVVDNASDADVVSALQDEARAGRIRLIESDRNYGFTHAVNRGIAAARAGSDILLLNNDAIVQGGAIQALQHAALGLPDAGMTVPRQILPGSTKTIVEHVPYANPAMDCDVNLSAHHRNIAQVPLFHDGGPLELGFAPFFAVYIRHETITALGPLDAEYGRHYRSDRVYCDMMRNLLGLKLYYVPEAHVLHKLQQATDRLRGQDGRSTEFELMFRRNQWDRKTAAELGFRFAPWDMF